MFRRFWDDKYRSNFTLSLKPSASFISKSVFEFIAERIFFAGGGAFLPTRTGARPDRRSVAAMSSGVSVWLIATLAGTVLLRGQSQPASPLPSPLPNDDPISTDRPAIAASSVVVPKGSFQAENGLLISNGQGQRTFDGPETSVRFTAVKQRLRELCLAPQVSA